MAETVRIAEILMDGGKLSEVVPNYKQRNGQVDICMALNHAYDNKQTVLINAPTGNGKSIGGLVPAILNKDKGKTIISTATKALQSQYENKDIPMLHKILNFKSHVMKGRENYVCLSKCQDNETSIPDEYKSEFMSWLKETTSGDLETVPFVMPQMLKSKLNSNADECLEEDCPFAKKCFYAKNKAEAVAADVLVINHDLLSLFLILKDTKRISIFGDVYGIILDEAHKFEDIMTKYLGHSLNVNSCRSLTKNILFYSKVCFEKKFISKETYESIQFDCEIIMRNMNSLFSDFVTDGEETTYRLYPNKLDSDICRQQNEIIRKTINRLPNADEHFNPQSDKKIIKRYNLIQSRSQNLYKIFDMLYNISDNILEYCYYVDACEDILRIKLNISPIDVSPYTQRMLFNRKSELEDGDFGMVGLMSATLFVNKSFAYIKQRLGIQKYYVDTNENCLTELSVKEMFDYKHSCLFYIPKGIIEPSNIDGDKKVFTQQIVDTLLDLDEIVDGGILSLFTSYSEMDRVYDKVNGNTSRALISQTTSTRQKALEDFVTDEEAIFFGTKTFWEGVDIQGRACSCVLIDRIPFPVPSDPIIEARIDKIKREHGNWFDDYYLPIAIIALQQGFGRLIRTHKDLGMVVLMDIRVITKGYGYKIINSLPNCLHTRNMEKVEVFWDVVRKKRELRKRSK